VESSIIFVSRTGILDGDGSKSDAPMIWPIDTVIGTQALQSTSLSGDFTVTLAIYMEMGSTSCAR
jgi:hypothetical protein